MVKDPAFFYTTGQVGGSAGIAASATASATVAIQNSNAFLMRHITAQFDQNDWVLQITLTGLGTQLFNQDTRGATLFGTLVTDPWDRGFQIRPPMIVPNNTTIVVNVTNGATGVLNLFMTFTGNRIGPIV
jgi:hypothetical protein